MSLKYCLLGEAEEIQVGTQTTYLNPVASEERKNLYMV